MLVIRLARTGRNKYHLYRIVAAESARPVTGKFVAVLGRYNPHTKEIVINKEQTARYIQNGAVPSNALVKLLQKEKVQLPEWVKLKTKVSQPKSEKPAEEPKAEQAPSDEPQAASGDEAAASEDTTPEAQSEQTESAPDAPAGEEATVEVADEATSDELQATSADEANQKLEASNLPLEEPAAE